MAGTLVYVGVAAGVVVIGAGVAIYRHFKSPCPTEKEFDAIFTAVDSGNIGRAEADGVVARFESQGCRKEADAIRKLLAAKDARGTLGGLTAATASKTWPDTDSVCKAAIDALPRDTRPNPTGGSPLPTSFYEIARRAATDSMTTKSPKPLYNVADLLESAAVVAVKESGFGGGKAAGIYAAAATCLRTRGDVVSKMVVLVAGNAPRVAGVGLGRFMQKTGQRMHPLLRRRYT